MLQSKQASLVNFLALSLRQTPGDVFMSEDVSNNFPIPQTIHKDATQETNTAVFFYLEEQTACNIKFVPIFTEKGIK